MPHGRFISFEGIDGSGKSTQVRALGARLRAAGRRVVETREPGGAPGAEAIRDLLVRGDPGRWSPETEILLFTAARRDHLERTILPALARGDTVICDRFADFDPRLPGRRAGGPASHGGRAAHDCVGVEPDLTLILDLDPAVAARPKRSAGRRRGPLSSDWVQPSSSGCERPISRSPRSSPSDAGSFRPWRNPGLVMSRVRAVLE